MSNVEHETKYIHRNSVLLAFYDETGGAILISYTAVFQGSFGPLRQDVPWSLLCLQFIAGPMWSRVTRKLR